MCTETENHNYFVCDLMWLFQPLGTEYGDRQLGELTGNNAAKALELSQHWWRTCTQLYIFVSFLPQIIL